MFRLGGGTNDYKDVKANVFFASINFDDLMAKKVCTLTSSVGDTGWWIHRWVNP